ncbi:hypothetical protein BD309DRAFT_947477 [Dichomitus squalens]|nr:hypothetical protein BD309DRAFT_947477 [Dichomitus squalens]
MAGNVQGPPCFAATHGPAVIVMLRLMGYIDWTWVCGTHVCTYYSTFYKFIGTALRFCSEV